VPDCACRDGARIAERAGLGDVERPDINPGTKSTDAWVTVTKTYGISDTKLAELVAERLRTQA